MSATYINNGGALLQISGIITASEVNALGTVPFVFQTPDNFMPLGFAITVLSGITTPIFTDDLLLNTVTNFRTVFRGDDPQNIGFYNFYGFVSFPLLIPEYTQALNIEIYTNNYQLTPANSLDPTPGDYIYKYNLIGTILF